MITERDKFIFYLRKRDERDEERKGFSVLIQVPYIFIPKSISQVFIMVVYRSCSPSYVIRNALLIIIRGACVVSNNNNKMLGNKGTKKFYRTG